MTDQQLALSGAGRPAPPAIPQDAPPSVPQMLKLAIERGLDMESITQLATLFRQDQDRTAASEFTRALLEFQKQCPSIRKNKQASFATKAGGTFSYAFANLEEICRTVNPLLHPLGLSYKWDSAVSQDGGRLKVTATLSHVAGHSVSATFEAPIDKGTGTSAAQDYAKVQTYGQRQSLIQVLGIFTADEDTDAAPSEPITAEQIHTLNRLIDETGTDRKRFLTLMRVENLTDLLSANYAIAVGFLEGKRAQQK